jgi:hypothetical protein
MMTWSNHPAAGKARIGSLLAIGHSWPGLPEPERWQGLGVVSADLSGGTGIGNPFRVVGLFAP